ncbi:MAG: serine/threonine-protein kinase PknK [Polyangiaceae bacterium]|nr:serine/threonine-protein kinase PknK [Polyangiaceae bacterium]
MSDSAPREYAPGDRLDERFLLIERLGRGGFGDVWRAEELLPDGAPLRVVALKLLHKIAHDAAHWAEEAKLLASFRHPSLVTIYAAGVFAKPEPIPFVAMELLEGRTLADVLSERKRVPWRRVVAWARAVAAALDVIHARDVIHLDLKPANIFLTHEGTIKVLDFGISRRAGSQAPTMQRSAARSASDAALDTAMFVASQEPPPRAPDAFVDTAMFVAEQNSISRQTASSQGLAYAIVGTPGYMAPEILELAKPAPTADAYALAATVVKLATGRTHYEDVSEEPPDASDPAVMSTWWSDIRDATLRGKLRDLAADPAGLPPGLVALLNRLLAVDPIARGVQPGRLAALFDEVAERPYGVIDPPYIGLAPLPKQAEGLLFGRGDDVARLGRELAFEPVVVLHGPRGVGKSSLARAALVPYLAREFVDGKDDWIEVHVRPGDDPDRALDEALGQVHLGLAGITPEALEEHARSSRVGVTLLVDPLEEALSAPHSAAARLTAILTAMADGSVRPGLRVLGVLGEAHVTRFVETDSPFASLRPALRFVGSPPAAAVHEIVTGPMRLAGVQLVGGETIANEVQRELRGADDRMPLVALALRSFWETRAPSPQDRTKMVLTVERWRSLGGVAGAVSAHAHRALAALDPEAREVAVETMLRLATTARKPIRWNEAELAAVVASDASKSIAVFDMLEREAILRRRDDHVELSHPSLASLSRIEEARLAHSDRLVLLERLHEAAIAWDRAGCHPEFLLTGSFYDDVMRRPDWLRRSISPLEKQFVEASRRLARRRKVIRGAFVFFSMAAIVAAFLANQAMEKREALADRARAIAAEQAYVSDVVSRSRLAEDPYIRTAWITEAIERGASDAALPLELFRTASNLPPATFLTLTPSTSPSFPWGDRWLLANAGGTGIVVVDFHFDPFYQEPPADGSAPAEPPSTELHPHTTFVRPHETPFVERVHFAFDTAFATRSVAGEVRVFRLRPDGAVALAAILPTRCTGALEVAERAPVLACLGDGGLLRWDLRRADKVDTHPFQGLPLDVSPDGEWIAAAIDQKVLVWRPSEQKTFEIKPAGPVEFGRFGPRENMLALVEPGRFEIFDPVRPDAPLMAGDSAGTPTFVRWDEGGLDLAICGTSIGDDAVTGQFHYLRKGARAPGDALPKGNPCEPAPREGRPVVAKSKDDVRDLSNLPLGPRDLLGGFRFAGGQFLTRDLVLLAHSRSAVESFVQFRGESSPEALEASTPAVAAIHRENDEVVAFQVNDEIRFYRVDSGKRELTRKGRLLRRCDDKRMVAWERDDKTWRVFDARSGATMATITREPGFVVGVDSACSHFYYQRVSGELVVAPFDADAAAYRVMAKADGYVYDVRPSVARGTEGPGLWLAVSSGALARIDEKTSTVRVMGYATPRASALSDGPSPGELVYADATGVVLLGPRSAVRLLEPLGATAWEDISVAPNGSSMFLLSIDRVAAVDIVAWIQRIPTSSTSKINVAFGGMSPG